MGNAALCASCPVCNNATHPLQSKIRILLVGLDNAGKTTIAKALTGERVVSPPPTVGFSRCSLQLLGRPVDLYDVGGRADIRPIWRNYTADCHALVYVVDATAGPARMHETRHCLHSLLQDTRLHGKPILVLANKQDVSSACDDVEVNESLQLEALANRYKCPMRIVLCSAHLTTSSTDRDTGLTTGFSWLAGHVSADYESLDARVRADLTVQNAELDQQRRERQQRVQARREQELAAELVANTGPLKQLSPEDVGPDGFASRDDVEEGVPGISTASVNGTRTLRRREEYDHETRILSDKRRSHLPKLGASSLGVADSVSGDRSSHIQVLSVVNENFQMKTSERSWNDSAAHAPVDRKPTYSSPVRVSDGSDNTEKNLAVLDRYSREHNSAVMDDEILESVSDAMRRSSDVIRMGSGENPQNALDVMRSYDVIRRGSDENPPNVYDVMRRDSDENSQNFADVMRRESDENTQNFADVIGRESDENSQNFSDVMRIDSDGNTHVSDVMKRDSDGKPEFVSVPDGMRRDSDGNPCVSGVMRRGSDGNPHVFDVMGRYSDGNPESVSVSDVMRRDSDGNPESVSDVMRRDSDGNPCVSNVMRRGSDGNPHVFDEMRKGSDENPRNPFDVLRRDSGDIPRQNYDVMKSVPNESPHQNSDMIDKVSDDHILAMMSELPDDSRRRDSAVMINRTQQNFVPVEEAEDFYESGGISSPSVVSPVDLKVVGSSPVAGPADSGRVSAGDSDSMSSQDQLHTVKETSGPTRRNRFFRRFSKTAPLSMEPHHTH